MSQDERSPSSSEQLVLYTAHLEKLKQRVVSEQVRYHQAHDSTNATNSGANSRSTTPKGTAVPTGKEASPSRAAFLEEKALLLETIERSAANLEKEKQNNVELQSQQMEARREMQRLMNRKASSALDGSNIAEQNVSKYAEILHEVEYLSNTVTSLQKERAEVETVWAEKLKALRDEVQEKDVELQVLRQQVNPLKSTVDQNEKMVNVQRQTIDKLRGELETARNEIRSKTASLQECEKELGQLRLDKQNLIDEAEQREALIAAQDTSLTEIETHAEAAVAAAREWERQAVELREQLEKLKAKQVEGEAPLLKWNSALQETCQELSKLFGKASPFDFAEIYKRAKEDPNGLVSSVRSAVCNSMEKTEKDEEDNRRLAQLFAEITSQQDTLLQTLQRAQDERGRLEIEADDLRSSVALEKDETTRWKNICEAKSEAILIDEEQNKKLADQLDDLQTQNKRLSLKNAEMDATMQRVKANAALQQEEAMTLLSQLKSKIRELEKTESLDYTPPCSNCFEMQQQLDRLEAERTQALQRAEIAEDRVTHSRESQLQHEVEVLQRQLESKHQLVAQSTLERDMAIERSKLQSKAVEEENQSSVSSLRRQTVLLQRQIKTLHASNNDLKRKLQAAMGENDTLEGALEQHRNVLDYLSSHRSE